MTKQKYTLIGANALLASAFFYSLTAILAREVSSMWGDKAQVAVRWSMAFFMILIFILYKKISLKAPKNKILPLGLLSISFLLVVMFFTAGIQRTSVANALFVFFSVSMLTAFVFGTFVLKESLTASKVIALILSFLGLAFFAEQILTGSSGIILCVISGFFGGLSTLMYKFVKNLSNSLILTYQFGGGSFLAIIAMLVSGDEIIRQASLKISIMTFIFSFIVIAGSALLVYGYRYFDVNLGTALTSSEIVFGVILAYILYGEIPDAHETIGGTLILIGSVVGSLDIAALRNSK